jgi:hypothetical protein
MLKGAPTALAGLGGYLLGRFGTRTLASGPFAGLGDNAEVAAGLATFAAAYLLTNFKPVRRITGKWTEPVLLGIGISAAQAVVVRLLPDNIKATLGLSGLGAIDTSNFLTPYDDLALSAYERVPTAGLDGMGAYERVPTAGLEGIEEHLAGLEGVGIGAAERMIDVAEAAAGVGANDVVEAAAGFGRYVPQLSAYERVPTAGFGGLGEVGPIIPASHPAARAALARGGRVVGVKRAGILKQLFTGKKHEIVHPATPGAVPAVVAPSVVAQQTNLIGAPSFFGQELAAGAKPMIEPIDRMKPIHMQSPSDAGAIPGSSLDSYAGIFSGYSAVGTPMEPY